MTDLEIALLIALAASLALCAWLWGRRVRPIHAGTPLASADTGLPSPPPSASPSHLDALSQPIFQTAAATLDVGMVVVDMARQVRFANDQAVEMLEAAPGALGGGLIALLRDHQAESLDAEVLRDGEPPETAMKTTTP